MKICATKLVTFSFIILAAILGTSLAVLSHPKLRRSVDSNLQNFSTASFIVVWKEFGQSANSTSRNVTVSDLMWQVQATGDGGGRDEDIPVVENARDNGIGVTADMNQAALESVSAFWRVCIACWCVAAPTYVCGSKMLYELFNF